MKYILSVDLGKESDYTAFSILEAEPRDRFIKTVADLHRATPGRHEIDYVASLRHLERPDVGTSYDQIVERTKQLMNTLPLAGNTVLVVDITGVGVAVVDWMLREGLTPLPISIHGGKEVTERAGGGFGVPKLDLAMAIVTLRGQRRIFWTPGLGLPKEDLTKALIDEMGNFTAKISKTGTVSYEAWREQAHDDLVLSVAMGAWLFLREHPSRHVYEREKSEDAYNPKKFK
jgi:hypothetical protein